MEKGEINSATLPVRSAWHAECQLRCELGGPVSRACANHHPAHLGMARLSQSLLNHYSNHRFAPCRGVQRMFTPTGGMPLWAVFMCFAAPSLK